MLHTPCPLTDFIWYTGILLRRSLSSGYGASRTVHSKGTYIRSFASYLLWITFFCRMSLDCCILLILISDVIKSIDTSKADNYLHIRNHMSYYVDCIRNTERIAAGGLRTSSPLTSSVWGDPPLRVRGTVHTLHHMYSGSCEMWSVSSFLILFLPRLLRVWLTSLFCMFLTLDLRVF